MLSWSNPHENRELSCEMIRDKLTTAGVGIAETAGDFTGGFEIDTWSDSADAVRSAREILEVPDQFGWCSVNRADVIPTEQRVDRRVTQYVGRGDRCRSVGVASHHPISIPFNSGFLGRVEF